MAYRNFQSALSTVAARDDMDMDTAPIDAELADFADTIDAARKTADGLADKYASLNSISS
jgi:ubiquinone biosynthesis protein UbiJ